MKDPNILLSLVNMKLRDFYSSLDAYCEDSELSKGEIIELLDSIGYHYDEDLNAFIPGGKDKCPISNI